jgi:muramoyltetrapeptide carboxypeptidase LdcA involved in peptidoglycan recycling
MVLFSLALAIIRTRKRRNWRKKIVSIVAEEFGKPDLPVVANFDVGHTDPQLVLPLGVKAEIDCVTKRIKLIDNWLK